MNQRNKFRQGDSVIDAGVPRREVYEEFVILNIVSLFPGNDDAIHGANLIYRPFAYEHIGDRAPNRLEFVLSFILQKKVLIVDGHDCG
ncbi:hypothetical protein JL2886_00044 [Phaeobacter gallaeciensis]|uniref:Uncharacterized protein n=1 Tax=Phaeobacter gallaeciensis TaxID=60890 RepID=A0A1B0ZLE8_9RHOB|nr:hypothetical protein JL2886_00044 [Phaeobacter gallaeciensis]